MKLIFRAGTTVYINSTGIPITCQCLSKSEFKKLKKSNPSEKDVLIAMGFDLADDVLATEVKEDDRFIFNKDGSVYRKGINLSIPKSLLNEFLKADDKRFKALDKFWMWSVTMVDPECREDLFEFLQKNELQITNTGMFVGYRNVDLHTEGNKKLHDFIVKSQVTVKHKFKKSTNNYHIGYIKNKLTLVANHSKDTLTTHLGTVKECYKNLSTLTETVYTDGHSGTFRIKIGEEVRIDRFLCDDNKKSCHSRGLHIGSLDFVKKGYFGQHAIACLINPRDVVAVPTDGVKFRCCAYFPFGLVEYNEQSRIKPLDSNLFEDEYTEISIDGLNNELKTLKLKEYTIHTLKVNDVGNMFEEYTVEMQKIIDDKIVQV